MFRNISINEKLWSFELGDCKVININKEDKYFMATNGIESYCYNFNGIHGYNVKPTIFWSEPKFEIPEKPFDLEAELKKLERISFVENTENYYISWDSSCNDIVIITEELLEQPLLLYFSEESIKEFFLKTKDKQTTKEQFFTAYKNVFGGRNAD